METSTWDESEHEHRGFAGAMSDDHALLRISLSFLSIREARCISVNIAAVL
jgi:hypothetical protein